MMKMSKRCVSRITTVICVITLLIGAIPLSVFAAVDLGNGWQGTAGSIQNIVSVDVEGSKHTVTIADGDKTTQSVAANSGVLAPVETGHYVFAFKVHSSTTSPEITIALSEGIGASGQSIGKSGTWYSGWFLSLDGMDDGEGTASFYSDYQNSNTKIGSDVTIKTDEYNFVYAELRGADGATQLLKLYLNGTYVGFFELWGTQGSGQWGREPYDDGTALEMAVGSVANAHAEITIDMDPAVSAAEVTALVNMCDAHTNPNAQVPQEAAFRAAVDAVREQLTATKDYYGWWALANTLNVAKAQYDVVEFDYRYGNGWGEYLGTVNTTTFETDDIQKTVTHIALANSGTAIRRTVAPFIQGQYAYVFSVASANTAADELIIQFATSMHDSATPGTMWCGWYLKVTGMNGDSPTMSVIEREGGVTVDRTTTVKPFEKDTEYHIHFQINSNNWIDVYANGEKIGSCCTWGSGHPNSSVSAYTSADAYGAIGVMATGGALAMSFDHAPLSAVSQIENLVDEYAAYTNYNATADQETAFREAVDQAEAQLTQTKTAYEWWQLSQALRSAKTTYDTLPHNLTVRSFWEAYYGTVDTVTVNGDLIDTTVTDIVIPTADTAVRRNGVKPYALGKYRYSFSIVSDGTTADEAVIQFSTAMSDGTKPGEMQSGWYLKIDGLTGETPTIRLIEREGNATVDRTATVLNFTKDTEYHIAFEINSNRWAEVYVNGTSIGSCSLWGATHPLSSMSLYTGTDVCGSLGITADGALHVLIDHAPVSSEKELKTRIWAYDAYHNNNASDAMDLTFRQAVETARAQLGTTKTAYQWWQVAAALKAAKASYDTVDCDYHYGNGWEEHYGNVRQSTMTGNRNDASTTYITFSNGNTGIRNVHFRPYETGKYSYSFLLSSTETTADELIIQFAVSMPNSQKPGTMWNGWYLHVTGLTGEDPVMRVMEREGGVTIDRTTTVLSFAKDTEYYVDFSINSSNWIDVRINGQTIGSCCTWSSGHPNSSYDVYTSADATAALGVWSDASAQLVFCQSPVSSAAQLENKIDTYTDLTNEWTGETSYDAFCAALALAREALSENQTPYEFRQSAKLLDDAKESYFTNDSSLYTFVLQNGASVSTESNNNGLRFKTYVSTSLIDTLKAKVASGEVHSYQFGTIMLPKQLLRGEALTNGIAGVVNIPQTLYESSDAEGTVRFAAVLREIPPEAYATEIAARGYLEVTYSDGSKQVLYTAFDEENNVRNVSAVAHAALTDSTVDYEADEIAVLQRYDLTHVATYVYDLADAVGDNDTAKLDDVLDRLNNDVDFTKRAGKTAFYVINFENREYRFDHTIHLDNIHGLTVNGNGAQFIFTSFVNALSVDHCEDMTLNNFSVDYYPLPFTQGTVASISGDTLTINIDSGYSVNPTILGTGVIYGNIHDRATGAVKKGTPTTLQFTNATAGDQVWQMKVTTHNTDVSLFTVGDTITLYARGEAALLFTNYKNVTLNDVDVYTSPGCGISSRGGYGNMRLNNVNVVPGPAPNGFDVARLHSTNSDGTHFAEHTVGPTLDNCTVTHCGDDGINVQSFYYHILEVIDENTIIACPKYDRDILLVGETLEFCEKTSYESLGVAKVAAIEKRYDSSYADEKTTAWGWSYHWNNEGNCIYEITLDRDVDLKQYDHFTSLDRTCSGTTVKNSTFGWNRARGIVVKSPDALIENNHIEACSNDGIMALPDLLWAESHFVSNLVVRGNTLKDNCLASTTLTSSNVDSIGSMVIGVIPLGNVTGLMQGYGNVNITVENNTITGGQTYGIVVTNANGVTVTNNTVADPFHNGVGNTSRIYGATPNAGIFIGMAKNVTVTGNTVTATNSAVTQAVQTLSVSGTVTNTNNSLN